MGGQWVVTNVGCFGTKKQQDKFYKGDYFRSRVCYGMGDIENDRVMFSISVPKKFIKSKNIRAAFQQAIKHIYRKRGGGAPRIVRSDELPAICGEVRDLIRRNPSLPSAIKRAAEARNIDPRTLKTALTRSGDLARLRKFASGFCQRKTRQIPSVPPPPEISGPPGRHYRRNIQGKFDDVTREDRSNSSFDSNRSAQDRVDDVCSDRCYGAKSSRLRTRRT